MNNKQKVPTYPSINATENDLFDITSIFLIVTKRCNLRCKYCFVEQEHKDIDLQTAIDSAEYIANNARKYGVNPSINFFGGEPLLRWHDIIVPLTMYVRGRYGNKFGLSMTSNCVAMTEEKLEFMKKWNIGLLFSIDGNKPTQDLNRPLANGKGSFDVLKDKIPMILKYYPNMTFRSTCDHDNAKEFFNNHKFAIENGFTNVFNIVNVFAKWSDEEKEELKHQIDLLGDYYFELYKQGKKVRFAPFHDMFGKLKRIHDMETNDKYRDVASNILGHGRCGIGAGRFASVGTNGDMYSCQEMVENSKGDMFKIGNIYTGVDNKARMNIIKQFEPKKVRSAGSYSCDECKLKRICDGGCLINNYFATGDLNIMPDILCFYYKTLLNKAEEINLKVGGLKCL